ncbi:hypothetical protein C8R44DRAFT_754030 [Mycena epipterygia]|nr:hypothetical protein C8R44DRAFT_754030 [Mycena epipterygia]
MSQYRRNITVSRPLPPERNTLIRDSGRNFGSHNVVQVSYWGQDVESLPASHWRKIQAVDSQLYDKRNERRSQNRDGKDVADLKLETRESARPQRQCFFLKLEVLTTYYFWKSRRRLACCSMNPRQDVKGIRTGTMKGPRRRQKLNRKWGYREEIYPEEKSSWQTSSNMREVNTLPDEVNLVDCEDFRERDQ